MLAEGEVREGRDGEFQISRCKLLHAEKNRFYYMTQETVLNIP